MSDRQRPRPPAASKRDGVALSFTCALCGRPVELVADANGVAVPDRVAFLELHASCLAARAQNGSSAPY